MNEKILTPHAETEAPTQKNEKIREGESRQQTRVSLTEKARVLNSSFLSEAEQRNRSTAARYSTIWGKTKIAYNSLDKDHLSEMDMNLQEMKDLVEKISYARGEEEEELIAELVKKDKEAESLIKEFFSEYRHDLENAKVEPAKIAEYFGETAPNEQEEGSASQEEPTQATPEPSLAHLDPSAAEAVTDIKKMLREMDSEPSIEAGKTAGTEAAVETSALEDSQTTSPLLVARTETYGRLKETLKQRTREESKERAQKKAWEQLGTSDNKLSKKAEKTNGATEAKAEYLAQTEEYIKEEKERIKREMETAMGEEGTINYEKISWEQEVRAQQIRAEAAEELFKARKDARTEILPTKAKEAVKRSVGKWAEFNRKHKSVKFVVGGVAAIGGVGVAVSAGWIASSLALGTLATRVTISQALIALGVAPKVMRRRANIREGSKEETLAEYRKNYEQRIASMTSAEEMEKEFEKLQKKLGWYDTKTTLLGLRDVYIATGGIALGLGGVGMGSAALLDAVGTKPSVTDSATPGISRISHEGMLGGEPTEAPPRSASPDTPPPPESVIRKPRPGSDGPRLNEYPASPDEIEKWPEAAVGEPRPDEPQFPARTIGRTLGESPESETAIVPEKTTEPVIHKVGKGEGMIKSLELEAKKLGLFKNLPNKEAQTNFIQNRYALLKNFTPEQLKEIATQPNGKVVDLNNLKPGDQLNLTRFFEDQQSVNKGIARSANLSPEEIQRIGENNKIIADRVAEWKEINPGKRLGDTNIENMLKPSGVKSTSLESSGLDAGDMSTAGAETETASPSKEPVVRGSEVRAAYSTYLDQKFPSKSFWSFLPWDKKGVDSLEWSQARNFNALEVDKFKGTYGGPGGKDGGAYYGKVGQSILRSQDFSKVQDVVAELKERSGLVPDKTETVEEFAKRAVEETFLNALPGKPTYYTS